MEPLDINIALSTEALAAITGMYPDEPASAADGLAAYKLQGEWRTAVKQFFDRENPTRFKKTTLPKSYAAMTKIIKTPDTDPVWLTQNMSDPDMVRAYSTVISNGREYIMEHWPTLELENFAGPQTVEPGKVFISEMGMIYNTVNDPSIILDEMLSHSLQPTQAEAFKTVFPQLFNVLDQLIEERKILILTENKSWKCPWSKERVLRNLFQMPPNISISEAPRPKAQPVTVQQINFKSGNEITRGQKLETT